MTLLMLSIVPPISLGAVSRLPRHRYLYSPAPTQVVYGRYLKKISNRTQEAVGDMSKVAQESLHSLRTVQAFNGYPTEEKKFDSKVTSVVELNKKEAWASALFFGRLGKC